MGVDAGSLKVAGSIDTTEIEEALRRINSEFKAVEGQVQSSRGSFSALGDAAKDISKHLITIGGVGLAALTGLAAMSPALAPEMAKIKNALFQVGQVFGEQLKPLFEEVGGRLIPAIGEALVNNADTIKWWVDTGVKGVGDLSSALEGDWDKIKNAGPKSVFMLAGAAAGYALMGPKGMFLGASLGYAVEQKLMPDEPTKNMKEWVEGAKDAGYDVSKMTSSQKQAFVGSQSVFDVYGGNFSEPGTGVVGGILKAINWVVSKVSSKDVAMAQPTGVTR